MTKALIPTIFGVLAGFLATYILLGDRDIGPVIVDPAPRGASAGAPSSAPGLDEHPAMIGALEAQLEDDPENVRLMTDIAGLYYDLEDFDRAVGYFRRALAIDPENVGLRTDLGTALFYLGRSDEAISELESALEISPNNPLALFNLGAVLVEARNDREGAIALWERLIAENPGWDGIPAVREEIEILRGQP
jgi:tetratricopeptide (TPR) repeat protein